MIKTTNNEIKNTFLEKNIFYAGYSDLQKCYWFKPILSNSGMYGWNYSAMPLSSGYTQICIMSGYRNMFGNRLTSEQIKKLEKCVTTDEVIHYLMTL